MSNKKVTRVGSGRTKGSVSFVTVKLGDLCSKIADPNTPIKVSRLQLEAWGFLAKPSDEAPKTLEPSASKPATTSSETDFDAQLVAENTHKTVKDEANF